MTRYQQALANRLIGCQRPWVSILEREQFADKTGVDSDTGRSENWAPANADDLCGRSAPNHTPSRCRRGHCSCRCVLRSRLRASGECLRSNNHPMPVVDDGQH